MIISASRRTDIPAFYGDWFMNRVKAGFCRVPNPYNRKQVSTVSLAPVDVDAIVFWTKHPAPMLPHLDALERAGYRFYFQYTLNDYPAALEAALPPLSSRIEAFRELGRRVGPERVVWRYDPIIVSNRTDMAYHRHRFERLCQALSPHTRRVVVSVVDLYGKTKKAFGRLEADGFSFPADPLVEPGVEDLLAHMARTAAAAGLDTVSCAEARDLSPLGIRPGRCIDGELIERLWGCGKSWKKDPHQREACGCAVSRDIGVPNTCPAGCAYCYATSSREKAFAAHAAHDANGEAMV